LNIEKSKASALALTSWEKMGSSLAAITRTTWRTFMFLAALRRKLKSN